MSLGDDKAPLGAVPSPENGAATPRAGEKQQKSVVVGVGRKTARPGKPGAEHNSPSAIAGSQNVLQGS